MQSLPFIVFTLSALNLLNNETIELFFQGYIMCVLGYNFHVLDNGFLVHKPGFKNVTEAARPELERAQRNFVEEVIFEELKILYGENKHCRL